MYLCSPSLFPSLYVSVTLSFFCCSLLYLRPCLTYLSIRLPSSNIYLSVAGILLSSFSLTLFVCLFFPPVSSSPPAHACLRVSTQLKCPEGPSFKHRNQKHMAHFQLPRSITAIYPEIAAKFPKVSSRFTTDCNVCLSHFKSGQFPLLPSTPCDFPSNVSKAFK